MINKLKNMLRGARLLFGYKTHMDWLVCDSNSNWHGYDDAMETFIELTTNGMPLIEAWQHQYLEYYSWEQKFRIARVFSIASCVKDRIVPTQDELPISLKKVNIINKGLFRVWNFANWGNQEE